MTPGIYIISIALQGQQPVGNGIAVLDGRRIHGGDKSGLYRGYYEENSGKAKATIEVISHGGQSSPIYGGFKTLNLTLQGESKTGEFTLTGSAREQPKLMLVIRGIWKVSLAQ